MPELRTTTPPLDFVDTEEQEIMDEEEDICKSLGLSEISVPAMLYNPLPLQCLAAEALPDNIKEEIDQVTSSSVYEFGHSSEPAKIVSLLFDAYICNEYIYIIYIFANNTHHPIKIHHLSL